MTLSSQTNILVAGYWQYIQHQCPELTSRSYIHLAADLEAVNWDEPTSAIEFNNFAVLALIEAEQTDSLELRAIHLEMALEALQKGVELNQHPLCMAHLAIAHYLLGDVQEAAQQAYSHLISSLHPAFNVLERMPLGLVYLPLRWRNLAIARQEQFDQLLQARDGYAQTVLVLSEILCQAQLVFYNKNGLRFLQLASQIAPTATHLNFKLGLASLIQQQWEGLLYLQRARKLAFDYAPVMQAMYLAYRDPEHPEIGNFWLKTAHKYAHRHPDAIEWKWAQLPLDSPMTYVPFEQELMLAVEPNLRSIVTSMLLAEGDWFEAEIEFWRDQIQPGMTVIDVGANVGVYTFSAARRVGPTGRVLAVEPFSGCVQCLQETCRVNQLSWVSVCAGAASDRNTTLRLSLRSASELNRVVTEDEALETDFEEIPCYTLDHLIEQENLQQVDWLKIDAEGHELQVLQGSDRLLTQFAPNILYENVAGDNAYDLASNNTVVAEFLLSKGYQLFRYRPYLQELLPIESLSDLRGNLNIIAIPKS